MTDRPGFDSSTEKFFKWLSRLRETAKLNISFDSQKKALIAVCSDYDSAQDVWEQREELLGDVPITELCQNLEVFVGANFFAGTNPSRDSRKSMTTHTFLSRWTQRNLDLFKAISGTVTIHSLDEPRGFPYLAVKPDLDIEERLAKPIIETIGQPIWAMPQPIAEPRLHNIREAIKSGSTVKYSYQMDWGNLLWKFNVSVIHLPGYDEVMTIVEDDPKEAHWQRAYWLNRVSR
jgi:hypothetical protein